MLQEVVDHQKQIAQGLVRVGAPGFLLALAGLKPSSHARIWVDNLAAPRCGLILSPTGWHVGLGDFSEDAATQATSLILGQGGLVPIEEWGIMISRFAMLGTGLDLRRCDPGDVTERTLVVSRQPSPSSEVKSVPDHRIHDVGPAEFRAAVKFAPMLRRFWPDPAELIEQRFGKAWIEDGTVLGVCYSCFHVNEDHDPHVVVREEHRGRGIGQRLTQAYAKDLLGRGQRIYWTHTEGNIASERCAAAIGLVPYGSFRLQQRVANLGQVGANQP